MPVQKLQTVDGFVVRDVADAPSAGIIRRGRKILQRSATDLARSATYSFAFHGIERGGASAGLNAEGDDAGPALLALVSELHDQLADGRLELMPAKGIGDDEWLGALTESGGSGGDAVDATGLAADGASARTDALVAGVLAATSWTLDGTIEGHRIFVEGDPSDPVHAALTGAASTAGAVVVEPTVTEGKPWTVWSTEADAVLVGSRPGVMNHQGAELLNVEAVIPWAPIPITTKALAVLISRDITYVPDFIAAAGPVVADHLPDNGASQHEADTGRRMAARVAEGLNALDSDDGALFIAACHQAEAFLLTWRDQLPFGRPLAG